MEKYSIENLDCATCAIKIEDEVRKTSGVSFVSVDFASATLFLESDDFLKVEQTINQVDPEVKIFQKKEKMSVGDAVNFKKEVIPLLIAGTLFIIGLVTYKWLQATSLRIGEYLVFGAAYLVSGWRVLRSAGRNITRGQIFDEHFLMSVATIGAIAIGEIPEAAGVMIFYLLGEFFQEISIRRSRSSIQALLEIRPDHANLLRNGTLEEVKPESIQVGETIVVKPGEKIPLDGEILRGSSYIDVSPLSGESVPQKVNPGNTVLAGAINKNGLLTVKVISPYHQSSIVRMLDLVESAASRKAETEKFITKFARVYSPLVVFTSLGVALIPPLFFNASFTEWIYRALVILVISCPCALVISIPLGYFGGLGGASRRGILVKGSNYLDTLASVKTVVFDKTGTLTKGVFKVTRIAPQNGFSEEDLLSFAAQAEGGSNHPIAQSIRDAYGKTPSTPPQDYWEIAGLGIQATVDGRQLLIGNDLLLHKEDISHDPALCDVSGTVVHIAIDGKYAGFLVISDEIKEDSPNAIKELRTIGVQQIVMLTGDQEITAQGIANHLGFDEFRANLLPEDKVAALEEILSKDNNPGKTAFIGDGINDAPSLARADVGIAMGGLGSEAAIETADVVIMSDSLTKVSEAIQIGRKTRQIVWQNIVMALIIKGLFIALGVIGDATMWQAVFADMGVAILAVLNATRMLNGELAPKFGRLN